MNYQNAAKHRSKRSLVGLLSAHAVSQIGNVVTLFAVPFYVLSSGGGGVEVGLAAAFAAIPVVIGGPLGGVISDRIGYRNASIAADLTSGITVLAIPLLALTVGLPFWALLALVFLSGLLDTPGQTARRVLLPELSAAGNIRLERSVGFIDGMERLASMLGAPLAGLLVAGLGATNTLFVNAVSFAVSALLTWTIVHPVTASTSKNPPEQVARSSYWAELADGFRFVKDSPLLLALTVLVLLTNFFDAARMSTLMPLYAQQELGGAAALGLILSVFGGGALLGSILFGFLAHRLPRRLTFVLCFTLAGGPSIAFFAANLPLEWLVVGCAVSGLAAGSLNPILGTVQLELVPPGMRGRVFGLSQAGAWAGMPLGAFIAGLAADTFSLTLCFLVIGVSYTVVTLSPLAIPSFRKMEAKDLAKARLARAEVS
ncbi:MFS transporter [Psychromicrobium lacuslunae]|uniref:MFS transporter n=1 Tax=Psychromicrobium lacuslunae TaxID=1618207 RepID=UPI0005D39582|nr:MFS transporter [Psychromicrobium lacuslunae]